MIKWLEHGAGRRLAALRAIVAPLLCVLAMNMAPLYAAEAEQFRIGAVRIDITPELPFVWASGQGAKPQQFESVHDPLYARAIVIDNGQTACAILSMDLVKVPKADDLIRRIAAATGIVPEHIVIAATHTHNEALVSIPPPMVPAAQAASYYENPVVAAYYEKVAAGVIQAVSQARQHLQPGRIGYGTGKAYINVNNGEFAGLRGGNGDPGGASDKTVTVLKFESLSGEPIAVFINYAVHNEAARSEQTDSIISADIAGATSAYVEAHYSNKPVVLWTSGAAAEQMPEYKAADVRDNKMDSPAGIWTLVNVQARRLGMETVRVLDQIKSDTTQGGIWGGVNVLSCPGQRATGKIGATTYQTEDRDPVDIRLGYLVLGDIALAAVGGELVDSIAKRIQQESPLSRTVVVTLAGNNSSYLLEDAQYQKFWHLVSDAQIKPGCAESGIPGSFARLMKQYWDAR